MNWPGLIAQTDTALVAHLGVVTTYQPTIGPAITVAGIFDAAYVRVEAGEAGISSRGPMVFYRLGDSGSLVTLAGVECLAELPHDPEEDDPTITIDGVTYEVAETRKDRQGGVQLHLLEQR